MSRKVILYIATSIDGYIAEKDGSVAFLEENMQGNQPEDSYEKLMEEIDTVVMGRKTYDQVVNELSPDHYFYEEKTSYIITHRIETGIDKRIFTDEKPAILIKQLKEEEGKAIWIIGGTSIITPLLEADLIDEYVLTTIPIILGEGIPLFEKLHHRIPLRTKDSYCINGLVYTTYEKP